jgi:hypothetical protein
LSLPQQVNNWILSIIEYKDGQYVAIASDLRWFLRVVDTPSGIPLLMCQELGMA